MGIMYTAIWVPASRSELHINHNLKSEKLKMRQSMEKKLFIDYTSMFSNHMQGVILLYIRHSLQHVVIHLYLMPYNIYKFEEYL